MSGPLLSLQRLEYRYPDQLLALRGLDLTIERGRKLALLGSNGSGKTTLLLHLNGTLRPTNGTVLLDGQPVRYDRQGLNQWRRRVGLVLQEPDDQLFAATVEQDVSFGPLNLGLSEAEAMKQEFAGGMESLYSQDTFDGVMKFLTGAGRGGRWDG